MASKQLWRWHGITGDGNAQDGMLWAESRALLLMALQQQMVTPLSLKRIAINSAQWRGDKSAEVIHQLATLLKAGLTLSEGLALLAEQHPSKQWQALLQSLAHDLEQGIAFSNAHHAAAFRHLPCHPYKESRYQDNRQKRKKHI